jgi:hypothetical protein
MKRILTSTLLLILTSCGVKSYSCNPTSGERSFTCYSKAEAPAQCKQTEGESE